VQPDLDARHLRPIVEEKSGSCNPQAPDSRHPQTQYVKRMVCGVGVARVAAEVTTREVKILEKSDRNRRGKKSAHFERKIPSESEKETSRASLG